MVFTTIINRCKGEGVRSHIAYEIKFFSIPLNTMLKYFYTDHEDRSGFFQIEIIIQDLVSSFRFISIQIT